MLGALNPFQQLRRPADFGPTRNQRADDARAARIVRVLIRIDFDAAVARLFDLLHESHRQAPARRPQRFHVRDNARQMAFF